ncbi:hypothetical protein LOD99_6120 [Oopsacas minuta]|uniref:Rhodanese domain-containing protein n=1 Tax=Oopsacas minuta TaxID=111878 RepID=A0AAV7JMN4_9METZ|nr:hypothetical protein LOD99_6120 [Oopsacas minuta]
MQSVTLPSGLVSKQTIGEVEIRTYFLSCLAQTSYIIIHENSAVLIDPRRDIDSYLEDLKGYELRAIFLTHIHADFVAGHKEVNIRTGAPIFLGPIDKSKVGFPFTEVKDGEHFKLSEKYNFYYIHSPGHTMESCVYLLQDISTGKGLAAFTGDTLFVGSVGRPDLVNEKVKTPQQMALLMYSTLYEKVLALSDDVIVFPAHGPGSPCGRAIQGDLWSTIGNQRASNPALQFSGKVEEFVDFLCKDIGNVPAYFSQAVSSNLSGGEVLAEVMSKVSLLAPAEFLEKLEAENVIVIDTRSSTEFQKGHIPKSIHFYLGGEGGAKIGVTDGNFAMLLGYVLGGEERLAVVAEEGKEAESVQRIARIGYTVSTCLQGGFKAWKAAGLPVSISEKRKRVKNEEDVTQLLAEGYTFIDVRFPLEYNSNHLTHAKFNLPLQNIRAEAGKLSKDNKYICYCKSGFRSSTAMSLLEGMGYNVCDLFGGFAAISTYAVKQTTKGEHVPMLTDIMKELTS